VSLLAAYARLLDRLLAELQAEYGDRLVVLAGFGSVGRGTRLATPPTSTC
jgi:hypothetical protein